MPAPAPRQVTPIAAAPATPSAVVAPAASRALGDEARLLRRALQNLRQGRNPTAALATLDEHRARFPAGLLSADADLVRIEALLALDRDREALALLEPLDLAASPRGDELRVVRGELRARTDCTRAAADFTAVLAHSGPDPLAERALRGRALCLLRTSAASAEHDLRAYLARFPAGRFAAEARARLKTAR
jgi:TolA-binding protein